MQNILNRCERPDHCAGIIFESLEKSTRALMLWNVMNNKKVFILDDDATMIQGARGLLEGYSYQVESSTSPKEALIKIPDFRPHLILLDIRMPEMDGFQVLRNLKSNPETSSIPVILVSVQNEEADVVLGLEIGAEDYIQKPFRGRELLARVHKVVGRENNVVADTKEIKAGPFFLRMVTQEAFIENQPVELKSKEFFLLAYFLKREGHVLTRAAISEAVWQTPYVPTSRTIDTHIRTLRQKMGRFGDWISTLQGVGYRFEMDV